MKDLLSRIGQWTEKMWRSIPIHLRDAIFTALLLGIAAAICFVLRSIDENGSFTLLIFVLGLNALVEEYRATGTALLIATLALGNVVFVIYDFLLKRLERVLAARKRRT